MLRIFMFMCRTLRWLPPRFMAALKPDVRLVIGVVCIHLDA